MSNYWKKKLEELEGKSSSSKSSKKGNNYWKQRSAELEAEQERKAYEDVAPIFTNNPFYTNNPLHANNNFSFVGKTGGITGITNSNKNGEDKRKWFEKGAFEDGYQFGDVFKTLLGTDTDIVENVNHGLLKTAENVVDAGAYGVGAVGKMFGADDFSDKVKKFVAKDQTSAFEESTQKVPPAVSYVAKQIIGASSPINVGISAVMKLSDALNGKEDNSVLGDKSDALVQSAAQFGAQMGLQSVGVPWYVTAGVTSFGSETENAFNEGATYGEAGLSGLISAGGEILSEKLFGGSGLGEKGLVNLDPLTKGITNKVLKICLDYGIDVLTEGGEEVFSQIISNMGSALYKEENLWDILSSEEALEGYAESFIGGVVISGGANFGKMTGSIKSGRDYRTGLSPNEQKVVTREVENRIAEQETGGKKLTNREKAAIEETVIRDMERGRISTDTIEEVLGGEAMSLVQNDRLAESYNEVRRKGEDFVPDFDKFNGLKYADAAKATVENAVKLGVNNTNKIHDFVDFAAKTSGDTGKVINFMYGEQINSEFIETQTAEITKLEGAENLTPEQTKKLEAMKEVLAKVQSGETTIHGIFSGDGIVLNIDSPNALNRVVGHEVMHGLEKAKYADRFKKALFSYANTKGVDIDAELARREATYAGIANANPEAELVTDLVGDYLFSDADFVKHLSVTDRNVFQKIWDEIKYLYNVATAGSKEARELEKVKKLFEDAYREVGKAQTDTKYSFESVDGIGYVQAEKNIFLKEDGTPASERDIFNSLVDKTIPFPDGDVRIVKRLPKKDMYNELSRRYPKNLDGVSDVKQLNSNVNRNMEELLANSGIGDANVPDAENKHQEQGITAFDTRTVKFYDGSKAYNIAFSIAVLENGEKVAYAKKFFGYDADLTKKIQAAEARSEKSPLNQQPVSNEKVTQDGENVKRDYFLSDNDGKQFSLSEPVEQKKDLVALHNLTADKLAKSLELGGMPMPSLAITKADIPHSNFGDITLIFGRETIDPKANKKNKVYSADAWTPVFPRVEYEADSDVSKRISAKLYSFDGRIDDTFQRDLQRMQYGYEDYLNSDGGEEGLVQRALENYGLKAAYLEEQGKHIDKVTTQQEAEKQYNPDAADRYQKIMDILGVATAEEVGKVNMKDAIDQHGAELETVYPGVTKTAFRMGRVLGAVKSYLESNGSEPVYNTVTDISATKNAVDEALDADGYEAWVRDLFSGIVKDSGVYNNKGYYTPSGNRRSFKQTHLPVTLENIVKAMAGQNDGKSKNVSGFNGVKTLRAATAETFKSVDQMHQRKDRLQNRTQEEADALNDALQTRLFRVMEAIDNESGNRGDSNPYIRLDSIGETLTEIGESGKFGVADIQSVFKQYGKTVSDDTAMEVKQLLYDVQQMPVNIFEAKPERVVGFDEAKVFVIPNNTDVKLKQELLNRGYSIAEYDPNIEGHRQQVVNQFEEYKFSLSNVGETTDNHGFAPRTSFDVFGSDLKKVSPTDTAPVQETTPVREDVAENATTTEEMFPDDLAPIADDPARFDSLTDEDAPPVRNVEYGEHGNQMTMPKSTVNMIAQNVKASLWVEDNQMGDVRRLIEEYGNQEFPSREKLFRDLKDKFGTHIEKIDNEEIREVKQVLRKYRLNVSDAIKSEITDYGYLRQRNFGKVLFSRQGTPVDVAYEELSEMYPGYFPKDIINPADQLLQIIDVANMSHTREQTYRIDDEIVWDVVNDIVEAVGDYQSIQRAKDAGRTNKDYLDNLVEHGDEIAPAFRPVQSAPSMFSTDGDLAPVYDAQPGKGVVEGQQAMFKDEPVTEEAGRQTRKQLHQNIVDGIRETFKANGFDLDNVLKGAKNLSTWSTVDNIPQRVMEKALGYKEGQVLSDLTVNKVAQNETEGIKWLNSFTDRKNGLLKQISDQYHIKPGSKESAAAQMYAEGFYVAENNDIIAYGDAELAKDFPNAKVQQNIKGLAADPRIRQIYDDTLAMINESRTRNAYPEIQKLDNYFLHFRAMDDTFSQLGLPFNPNDIRAKDLPTDLNGVTADLKPGQPYFASAMHRTGKRTSFDLLGGLERYLNSAKNQIYHIDDIQTLRALRNYIADTYGQANGLEGLDVLSEEEAQDRIEKVYNSHLSTFAKFLNEEANILAGKTALIDRGLEGIIGRRGITLLDTVNKQVGSNMVGFNISSSLTNFLPVAQTFAKTNKADFVKAFGQTVGNKIGSIFGRTDGFAENSPVIIRRKGADRLYRTPWQKAGDVGYVFMSAVDDISTELIARTKYNELTRKGMDAQQAHYETDKWVSRLMGDRSLGQMPQLYNSKMLGLFTKFQLEVRNQLDAQFYDTIQETKVSNEHIENGLARNAKIAAKVTSTFVQLAVAQHLFGKAFESVAGYNPAFDIVSVLMTAFGFDDEEDSEDTALDNIEQGFLELLEDLPYTSTLTGGRIPISSALPITELVKGVDEWGNEKSRWGTMGEIAPYYLLPGGYGQIKKTKKGLDMFADDLPIAGSYTDSGNLRFPVEDTIGNRIQAGIFGQWASENARDYFDNERSPLKENQIQEFMDVDIPIRDYWEYREGLSGLSKLEEQADYIAGLDLPIDKKNLLINNIANREDPIDLTGYEDFGGFAEFDFAVNNPEKYEIAQKVGGYEAYMEYQEGMKGMKLAEKVDYIAGLKLTAEQKNALINGETDRKEPIDLTGYNTSDYSSFEEFEFAKEYPEKYAVAKAVGGYEAYTTYSSELSNIEADKDKYGKSIRGSLKAKVLDYINNLDADYYTKIILWKSEYNSDDSYNYEIIDYLNGRDDISFKETIAILRNLGFDVTDNGDISW